VYKRQAYYLADTETGSATRLFTLDDVPGRIEELRLAPEGVLILVLEKEDYKAFVYDFAQSKIVAAKDMKLTPTQTWNVPKKIEYVTYLGGYRFDTDSGKVTQLFSYKDLSKRDNYWRQELQDARLYARKDGGYNCVSVSGHMPDVRILKKDGTIKENLLRRQ
jgi:hypothetical protein